MAVVIVQHTPTEVPDALGAALEAAGLDLRTCRVWAGERVPETLVGVDALVVLGGPPGGDHDGGLAGCGAELELLRAAVAAEVPVLGVRLGARLLAAATAGAGKDPGADGAGTDPGDAFAVARIGAGFWSLPYPDGPRPGALERFAALVAARCEHTAARAFFTQRAGTWEDRFAYQTPAYEAAVARMAPAPGRTALDLGCGTGRAMPALRALVGPSGRVFGVDVTHAMLVAAARAGRGASGPLLLADCSRLPFPAASVHAVFAAGLLDHVARPAAALREWARVTAPDGELLIFHPAGRAERAARHGRPLSPDDLLAETTVGPLLAGAGWRLTAYEDAPRHFLALARPTL